MRIARALFVIAAFLVFVYVVDDLAVRYRLTRGSANDPLDAVSVYYATRLKNKTIEIFYHQPVTETCVRALFPHLGHAPCWYLRRHTVRLVHAVLPSPDPWPSTSA